MIKKFIRNKIRNSEFLKGVFRPIYLRKTLVFPNWITIETTSLCNARCLHCEYTKLTRPHAHMEMDLYKKIIDECYQFRKYCKSIVFSGIGEPFLDPTFFEKVKYAKRKDTFFISTYSNASLLTPVNCQKLIDSKIDKIIFSVDGASKESYETLKPGLSYERMVEGIKRLVDLKKKMNVKIPRIIIRMTVTPFNAHEVDLFKKKWQEVDGDCYVQKMFVWGGDAIDKDLTKYSHQHLKKQHSQFTPCFSLWKSMIIAQDGRIALCCVDADIQEEIGDFKNESIYEIWHGDKLKRIKAMHLAGKIREMPICQKCNFRETKEYPWWWY